MKTNKMNFGELMDMAREESKAIIAKHQDEISAMAETVTDELFPDEPKYAIEDRISQKVTYWMAANDYKSVPKEVEQEIIKSILK